MKTNSQLRKMLDKHGVEHKDFKKATEWTSMHGARVTAFPVVEQNNNERLVVKMSTLSPEQAVEATLGRTCRNIAPAPESDDTFECSECDRTSDSWERLYYCPKCGARIEDE